MNHAIEKSLGETSDICDVCDMPLTEAATVVKREYLGKLLDFCSNECLEEYLKDPAKYAEFDEAAE